MCECAVCRGEDARCAARNCNERSDYPFSRYCPGCQVKRNSYYESRAAELRDDPDRWPDYWR